MRDSSRQLNEVHSAPNRANARRLNILLTLSVLVTAALPYLNALPNDFVWDDRPLILHDHQIRSVKNLPAIFRRDFFGFSENQLKYGYYRPLVTLSYMMDWAIWHRRPWGFRLTNVIFHAGCSLLVVALAIRLKVGDHWAPWWAGWIFAVHPVHTESVAWIAGRTDVLGTFFLLWAFLLHSEARDHPARWRIYTIGAFAAWTGAVLCKETALVFPLLIFLYERSLRHERFSVAFRQTLPFVIAVVLYTIWRSRGTRAGWNPLGFLDPALFLSGLLKTVWRYVVLLFWPVPLSAYIQNPPLLR